MQSKEHPITQKRQWFWKFFHGLRWRHIFKRNHVPFTSKLPEIGKFQFQMDRSIHPSKHTTSKTLVWRSFFFLLLFHASLTLLIICLPSVFRLSTGVLCCLLTTLSFYNTFSYLELCFNILWFCKRTGKALISLHGYVGLFWQLLCTFDMKGHFSLVVTCVLFCGRFYPYTCILQELTEKTESHETRGKKDQISKIVYTETGNSKVSVLL